MRDFDIDRPAALHPVTVEKPWGREVWYSGIEARGESRACQGNLAAPLSRFLAAAGLDEVILLKALEATDGDLYLEVHETKEEVYVATTPGTLQLGMNQTLRSQFEDDESFRQAFCRAAMAYEAGRVGREAVDEFVTSQPLAKGDVIAIEPWMPHSLQRGVSVIEFQTPVFERYILASNQAVVTQQGWDTERALPRIKLNAPTPSEPVTQAPGIERLAATSSFSVWRARDVEMGIPRHASYVIGIVTAGHAMIGDTELRSAFLARKATSVDVDGEVVLAMPAP